MKNVITIVFVFFISASLFGQASFNTSLHKTREGKNTAYKVENGGMESITNIPMSNLACQKCHSTTEKYPNGDPIDPATYTPGCNDCHNFAAGSSVPQQVCISCHNRQNYEMQAYPDTSANGDVHRKAGLSCTACHTKAEVHGDDGIAYSALKEPGAIKVSCVDCHSSLPANTSHSIHNATVDCAACHAVSVLTCAGCHFESVVASGKNRAINQIRNYRLLVKKEGKIRLGGFMTHSFDGKTNYIISSYHSHVITKNATVCSDCHQNIGGTNAAITEYNNTGYITMTKWNSTTKKIAGPSGVVPIPADWKTSLKMDYVTYTGDPTVFPGDPNLWVYLKSETDNSHMFYAEPLDSSTLAKLGFTRFPGTPVPVELTNLTASVSANQVSLSWTTATETNNNGFEVQRKLSDKFITVGFVRGNGTTAEIHQYGFTDKVEKAGKFIYRLKQIDYDGTFEYSKEIEVMVTYGMNYALGQNYPNPFNPTTKISYSIPQAGFVQINIYDVVGNLVETLVSESKEAGYYSIEFDGLELSSGIYYYQLKSGSFIETKKLVLMK